MSNTWREPLIVLVFSVVFCGCSTRCDIRHSDPRTGWARDAIYRRIGLQFANAVFLKPGETNQPDALALKFAPLILQEIVGADTNAWPQELIGRFTRTDGVRLDKIRPAVYFSKGKALIAGRERDQFTYLWFHESSGAPDSRDRLSAQGIRITLDSKGQPAIGEVLADASGVSVVFVSQSLEAAAAAEYGPPLPERRHTIERSTSETPKIVVAGIIEDSPLPMGPIIHLEAGTHNVSTIICRCTPAQAKQLVGQESYELIRAQSNRIPVAWETGRLESVLRLPRKFQE